MTDAELRKYVRRVLFWHRAGLVLEVLAAYPALWLLVRALEALFYLSDGRCNPFPITVPPIPWWCRP